MTFTIHGIVIRLRVRWVEQAQKNTAYFLNLEKPNSNNNIIWKLKSKYDSEVTDDPVVFSE